MRKTKQIRLCLSVYRQFNDPHFGDTNPYVARMY